MKKDVFISYKSEELEEASWVKSVLEANGISCWMAPDCIQGGSSYAEAIPQGIRDAKAFVLILSAKSQASKWVSREVDLALNEGKVILPFMLENFKLKDDFNFYLTNVQRYAAYENKSAAIEKMLREIKGILGTEANAELDIPEAPASKEEKAVSKKSNLPLIIGIAAAVIAIVLVLVFTLGGKKDDNKGDNAPSASPTVSLPPVKLPVEMSDELFDFTVDLGGTIVKIPCDYSTLEEAGWTISTTGVTNKSKLSGCSSGAFSMIKDGKKITVTVYNESGHAMPVSACKVGELEWDGDFKEVKLAKGINVASTVDDILAAYGTPSNRNDQSDYVSLKYYSSKDATYGVSFMIYTDPEEAKYSYVSVRNDISTGVKTETSNDRPEYLSKYTAPTALEADPFSEIISVDGDLYRLPAPLSEFLNNGWTIKQHSGAVPAGKGSSVILKKDDSTLTVNVMNYSELQVNAENCAVYGVDADDSDKVQVQVSSLSFESTKAQVSGASDKFEYYEGASTESFSYYESKNRVYSLRIYVNKSTGKVSQIIIRNENWSY
jgi:hypothetical protein